METPTLPQPITREEFEDGVKFYQNDNPPLPTFFFYFEEKYMRIFNYRDGYYCDVKSVNDKGFTFTINIFDQQFEAIFFFKNCIKAE